MIICGHLKKKTTDAITIDNPPRHPGTPKNTDAPAHFEADAACRWHCTRPACRKNCKMEEMVASFLPFFVVIPYLRTRKNVEQQKRSDYEKNTDSDGLLRHDDDSNGRLDLWHGQFYRQPTLIMSVTRWRFDLV